MPASSWRFTVGLPRQPPTEPSPRPGVEACSEFFGTKPERDGVGRVFVEVGVQSEQRTPPVKIELSKPSPTAT